MYTLNNRESKSLYK